MKRRIAQLQYIGAATALHTQLELIEKVLEAGVRWVQLRLKDKDEAVIYSIGKEVRQLCDAYQATFLLNDYPEIAKAIAADGVHLGQNDLPTSEARTLLGDDFVIGGTANTWEEVKKYADEGVVDYIGLGPFRFTKTKKKLSPVLGVEGYRRIIEQCKKHDVSIPIVAIGGIQLDDIEAIVQTGVHGIAVSGLITYANDKTAILQAIHQRLL